MLRIRIIWQNSPDQGRSVDYLCADRTGQAAPPPEKPALINNLKSYTLNSVSGFTPTDYERKSIMITVKDIADKSMTPEKKAMARNDLFAFYIGRPLSYVLTIPFLYTGLSPNTISIISIIPAVFGFLVSCVARNRGGMIAGWALFFMWNLLNGVDGNVARYKKQFSALGSVYDAMAGYIASALMFYSAGIMAAHSEGPLVKSGLISPEVLIICGGLIAIVDLLPRLVMHKAVTTLMDKAAVSDVMDKADYGIVKTIALNLRSCAGGAQFLLLVAILLNILDLYTVCYLLFNTAVMLLSLRSVLRGKSEKSL